MQRALEIFNASEHVRTVGGVARSLGAPAVAVRPLPDRPSVVRIAVMWELSWYRYEIDLSDEGSGVRREGQGDELSDLTPEEQVVNAAAGGRAPRATRPRPHRRRAARISGGRRSRSRSDRTCSSWRAGRRAHPRAAQVRHSRSRSRQYPLARALRLGHSSTPLAAPARWSPPRSSAAALTTCSSGVRSESSSPCPSRRTPLPSSDRSIS